MNDISLIFLDYKKFKQCLRDLERDTDITWFGGGSPTSYFPSEKTFFGRGFYELRINQPRPEHLTPFLTYGGDMECLQEFLKDEEGFMFLIK